MSQAEKSELRSFSPVQAHRLTDLYRRVSADLVQARTFGAGAELTGYLESLVARGYALLYPAAPLGTWRSGVNSLLDTFPRAVRRETMAFGLVVLSFVLGLTLGGMANVLDPQASRLFIPAEHQQVRPAERVRGDEDAQRTGKAPLGVAGHAAFSSFLFTHNIGVSITCFAIGIAWGLPTLLLIAYHGVFIAALGVEYFRDGVGLFFLAWILPHGVVELTCMFFAGTAGLVLGRGILWPRGKPRAQRLREEARSALELLGGSAALLVLAGVIEGTISQIHEPTLPYFLKLGMALVLAALLYGYLWLLPLRGSKEKVAPTIGAGSQVEVIHSVAEGRSFVVRTPEGVAFTYPLAGPVERLCAFSIDFFLMIGLMISATSLTIGLGALGLPLFFVASFLVSWGYFVFFEWRWNGATPGKKMLGIKVMQIGGVRCSLERLLLRNFLRVLDSFPILYALGSAVVLLSRRGARLGDLAAGTVCVRVPAALPPGSVAEIRTRYNSLREDTRARERIRQVLTSEESSLVVRLALRRELLERQARIDLFAQYAVYLRRRLRLTGHDALPDESLVLNVASVLLEEKVL